MWRHTDKIPIHHALPDDSLAQISLGNTLTIPVSFRAETLGPFAINPAPSKKRLAKHGSSAAGKMDPTATKRARKRGQMAETAVASKLVTLLPGQTLQLELVFLPARASNEMAAAIHSSFAPGSEVMRSVGLSNFGWFSSPSCLLARRQKRKQENEKKKRWTFQ